MARPTAGAEGFREGEPSRAVLVADRDLSAERDNVTHYLQRMSAGDPEAERRVYQFFYDELKRQARAHMRRQASGHILQATALVSEVYLRLAGREIAWSDRGHFLRLASRAMRSILVDEARRRDALRRGGKAGQVPLEGVTIVLDDTGRLVSALDVSDALAKLAQSDDTAAKIVELRMFGGLSNPEVAKLLDLGLRTVERKWRGAKMFLESHLS